VPGWTSRGELRPARGFELERGAEARVDGVSLLERPKVARVERTALRLAVRSTVILLVRAGVPVQPQPAQVFQHDGEVRLLAALRVRVLDTQQETPAAASRQEKIEERRARIAEVQLPRGARRKARHRAAAVEPCGSYAVHSDHA